MVAVQPLDAKHVTHNAKELVSVPKDPEVVTP